jgi:xanthine dehydrogenase accessory factor
MSKNTKELYGNLMSALADGRRAAVLTVYAADGGIMKTVVSETGVDASVETGSSAWHEAQSLAAREGAVTDGPVTHVWQDGTLTVLEQYQPTPRMIILGGGHIALALAEMAKLVDFGVLIFDDRPMFANPERFPGADEVICDDFTRLFDRVKVRPTDYVVIVTRGHKHDTECLEGILRGEKPAYTGMIGSRRRVAIVMRQLEEAGYDKERLADVRTPIGLPIGAVTPQEISVSIVAEVIQVRRLERGAAADANTGSDAGADIETAAALALRGEEADALITILETHGSVPRETGAKMSMSYEGNIIGTIGGGCAESGVMHDARTVIREGGWRVVTVDMTDTAEEDGMVCGGQMQALIEKS